tara:strand:+ start:1035 stop:1277 length:243 start_codon:yes stop_codon:yes gene_type:complete
MDSHWRYNNYLTKEQKIDFNLMIVKKTPIDEICKKYKVSKRFVKYKSLKYSTPTIPIYLGSKQEPYYSDEMMYGKLNLNL